MLHTNSYWIDQRQHENAIPNNQCNSPTNSSSGSVDFDPTRKSTKNQNGKNMGNKVAVFTDKQLENYQDCTYFTRQEILTVYKRFRELDPKTVPSVMTKDEPHTISIPMEKIIKMAELRENPFRERICRVFSHDGTGNMTFDDFLDMLSVFSENASRDNKLYYAFKIYDYNEDQLINGSDVEQVVQALTRNELTQEEVSIVTEKVLEEADIDDDKCISFSEFRHVISRAPEFLNTFHMRI